MTRILITLFLMLFCLLIPAEVRLNRSKQKLQQVNEDLEKRVEDRTTELKNTQQRFELAIQGTDDGIWDWDITTNKLYYSDRFRNLLGYDSADEFPNEFDSFANALHPDDKERILQALQDHITDHTPYDVEYRLKLKNNKYKWFQARGKAITGDDGKAYRMAGSITDIEERKKTESLKNEFVSMVSHELRTPFTSIRGSLGLIVGGAMGDVPDKVLSLIKIAESNSERLVRLINDILDIEKIEAGKMRYQLEVSDICKLVERAGLENKAFADEHNVTFGFSSNVDDAMVNIDTDKIRQVIDNLLSNAAKFSRNGTQVVLEVKQEGDHVTVKVTDHGTGIPDEFKDSIFQKFSQADSSDTRRKGGTGLGLSIAKAIIEDHKGEIGFSTLENVGTTFFSPYRYMSN